VQLLQPLGVVDIGLAAGNLGVLGGVGEDAGEGLLEDVEDGPPVHTGALHRHVGDAVGLEPIPQRQELRRWRHLPGRVMPALAGASVSRLCSACSRQQCGVPEAPPSVYVRTRGTNGAADGSERSAL
jgi:hypothetical protein